MIIYREQAETLFRLHPDYSGVQVEIHDKREALLVSSGAEINSPRSRARAELMMSVFRIHAVAYLRLVDNMNFHEAYSVLLDDLVRDMWSGYVKLDRGNCSIQLAELIKTLSETCAWRSATGRLKAIEGLTASERQKLIQMSRRHQQAQKQKQSE